MPSEKRLKRAIRKEKEKIKIKGLREFFEFTKTLSFKKRFRIWKIILKVRI